MSLVDKNTVKPTNYTLNCRGKLIDLSTPKIMGILNITSDSFYSGSHISDEKQAIDQAERMLNEGATFIDIGGMSSRPGAEIISSEIEKARILPIVKRLLREMPNILLSIDTIHAETAVACLNEGASMINDISGGLFDHAMIERIAPFNVPYVLMHMKGTPATMKSLAEYDDLIIELIDYFIERSLFCQKKGIVDIVLDPGFGFAKTIHHNFELLNRLNELHILDYPILTGLSRKSMIWKTLNIKPEEALNGTTALHMACLLQGSSILRVHDVKEAAQCIALYNALIDK